MNDRSHQLGFGWLVLLQVGAWVAALVAVWWFLEGRCNSQCKDVTADLGDAVLEIKSLKAEALAANKERERVSLAWAQDSVQAQAEAIEVKHENEATFNTLRKRADRFAADRTVVISADTVELFSDVARAANGAQAPADASGDQRASVAIPRLPAETQISERDLGGWVIEAGLAYRACVAKHSACVSFYEKVRAE